MSLFESTKQREICPKCGAELQMKKGKHGLFLGCSSYPKCDYIKSLHQSYHIIKTLDELCPDCRALLQLKQGSFGIFIGCSQYPHCYFCVHEQIENDIALHCPECQNGYLVKRSGRSGKAFYGCDQYPKCKFTLASKPIEKQCPICGFALAIEKKQKYQCANKQCQHFFSDESNDID